MKPSILATALLLFVSPLAGRTAQAQAQNSQWSAENSNIQWEIVHKLHRVQAATTKAKVVARLQEGVLQIMAEAPVESFLSGNTNRDAHVLEVVEAAKFPLVRVRALAEHVQAPTKGADLELALRAEVDLHGVKTYPKMQATLRWVEEGVVSAEFSIDDTIEAHQIVRPKLLFVPVDDTLHIVGQVRMKSTP